jgi:hypothetical protein
MRAQGFDRFQVFGSMGRVGRAKLLGCLVQTTDASAATTMLEVTGELGCYNKLSPQLTQGLGKSNSIVAISLANAYMQV